MDSTAAEEIDWSEQGLIPDTVIRHGIRQIIKKCLADLHICSCADLRHERFCRPGNVRSHRDTQSVSYVYWLD